MRRLRHLAGRFFKVLAARDLGPVEQEAASCLLRPAERHLFWSQPGPDQRHALECARAVLARRPDRLDLARAALLHDVGKRHAGLGALARTVATTLEALHLPAPGRLGSYLRHGPAGAADLEAAGADPLIIAFARHHHTGRPDTITVGDWDELQRADHG